MGQAQQTFTYNVKDSVPYDLTALVAGLPVHTTYAANAELNDPTKGLATLTVMDMAGNVANDANGIPLNAVTMFQHPTDTNFHPVFTVVPGFALPANYKYLIWWELPVGSELLRDSEYGITSVRSNSPFEKNPPA